MDNDENTLKTTMIVSGFPGVGKSYLHTANTKLKILDSDSSKFSWLEPGIRNPQFPQNYIEHIMDNIGKVDLILVSSHYPVRKALEGKKLNYVIVYPDIHCKDEYIERYIQRGSDAKFVAMMMDNWDTFITQIDSDPLPLVKIRLNAGMYLSDALDLEV